NCRPMLGQHFDGQSGHAHVEDANARHYVYKMGATVVGGRYVLQRQLGQGGQGDVYQALDSHEGDVVAIKLLRGLPPSGQWVEAQILRRLNDAHILPIRNADVAAGQPYLVTELAQHGTLEARLGASG